MVTFTVVFLLIALLSFSCFGQEFDSIYDVKGETDIHGNEIDFNDYRGKVLYVVNVASQCGYTSENYEMFRNLKKFRDEGLEIILAPCNQFGSQEPGDASEIRSFADKQDFEGIILSKGDVIGHDTRPLFRHLKEAGAKAYINWNFAGKFVVSRTGKVRAVTTQNVEDVVSEFLNQKEL